MTHFFPAYFRQFALRVFVNTSAMLILLLGLFFLVSLLSYNHKDLSLNTFYVSDEQAEPVSPGNFAGFTGAAVSDVAMQGIGPAAIIPAFVMVFWGITVFRKKILPHWKLRLAFLVISTLAASISLARLPVSGFMEDWLVTPYAGGVAGTLMLNTFAGFFQGALSGWEYTVIAVLSGVVSLVSLFFAIPVRKSMLSGLSSAIEKFIDLILKVFDHIVSMFKRVSSGRKAYQKSDQDAAKEHSELKTKKVISDIPEPEKSKAQESGNKRQRSLKLEPGFDWELPPPDLLQEPPAEVKKAMPDEDSFRKNASLLQSVLEDFNVFGQIVKIHPGPVVTLYEFEPAPGTKTSRVVSLSDDIARSMAAVSVRVAVIPGRNVIGIELPNKTRLTVFLRELIEAKDYIKSTAKLPLILGKDIGGHPVVADLSRMPHLLVAGTTGSGKSVAINTMILSLLYRMPPEKCRLLMIDPKMLELSVYEDIPHLLSPVVTDPGKAVVALKWVVQEMENRYRSMSKLGVRNIEGYNNRLCEAKRKGEVLMRKVQTGFDPDTGKPIFEEHPLDLTELPYIVVVVDEFADLMLVAGKDIENAVQRLAQMARAAGIHLIMATQRPSVDVITGVVKANFPTRISFQVTSKIDSRTILGESGAEQLLGMGDMLHMAPGGRIKRVHGPFVEDGEVEKVSSFLKQQGEPSYLDDITEETGDFGDNEVLAAMFGGSNSTGKSGGEYDALYDQAVAIIARERKASTSFIQRHLHIGYNRAARIIEKMEKEGVISHANHAGKREVLIGDFSDA